MLKKSLEHKFDWARQIKYAVFACRSAPNRDLGFSPFELVFGKTVRGLLELLGDMWVSKESKAMNVCRWVEELEERLCVVWDAMRERMIEAKDSMKKEYDKRTGDRSFEEGAMVLMRVPGLSRKIRRLVGWPL